MTARTTNIVKLYELERGRLRAFVRRIIGNQTIAEDVVQQAFTNILAKVDSPAPSSAYMAKAVRNLALNHLRDAKKRAQIEIADSDIDHIADACPSPEMITLYRCELQRLLLAVAALPPRRREAFVLNKIEDLSYDEVSERMKISRNTVITLVVSAMADLDRQLTSFNY